METLVSPNPNLDSASSSRSRSSSKLDDVTSLTSFNPFSEEDENDQSSYALVTSLFSRVKNTLAAPLAATGPPSQINPASTPVVQSQAGPAAVVDARRPSLQNSNSNNSNKSASDRPNTLNLKTSNPAAPLVSLTPVTSETPSYVDFERTPSQGGSIYSPDTVDGGGGYGTAIPGFPIQDSDARSIRTTTSIKRSASVSKVIRRIRGEGLSKDYWMDDALCKECYDCKSVFTAWRRKHHCRICGQIYCSRCASNIIKGARFGHDGMVRVCNLCLEKLAKGDDDDDDDRRSIISSFTSPFAAHQLGTDPKFPGLAHVPQSPFAASQLFGRSDSFSLFSIAETRRPHSGSEESGFGSRPITPGDDLREDRVIPLNPVPFRRALTEEERDPVSLSDQFRHDHSPSGAGCKTPVDFPVTVPVSMDGLSSVAFPISSPDTQHYGFETPGLSRSRYNSYADFDGGTFIRSRVQSRLADLSLGEPGWRVRRESTAYAQELNTISMFHLRIMLRQMLTAEVIPNIKEWEETLLKLALRIARELTFTAHPHRQGADMDVRRYVKIKKIPGGSPSDSEYVDGAVITKNVAHKHMSRLQRNPRVMLVTFPLEFHRIEGQYMHFGQIFRQEKEYLGNLASRIAALRPHVVLAEKSVSRLALEALASHRIAVARTVKPSAVQFVARMTQGDVFSSMDKLALEPHLGHCARFRIQTFDHPLIPGRRKTFMRFEGCNREMGCTIILRGGDIATLKRIKKVTRFLAFIVRNLRLETHLWKDSVITLPRLTTLAIPFPQNTEPDSSRSTEFVFSPTQSVSNVSGRAADDAPQVSPSRPSAGDGQDEDLPDEDAERIRLSKRIEDSLEPYRKTFISVSATLRFQPPHPIRRMKELDDELIRVKQEWEDDLIRREEKAPSAHLQEETITETPVPIPIAPIIVLPAAEESTSDLAAQIESLPLPDIPPSPSPGECSTSTEQPSYFDLPRTTSAVYTPGSLVSSPMPRFTEEEPIAVRSTEDLSLESRVEHVKWQHEEQRRIWEWYLRKNKDDFDVEKYQCISLWEFTLPIADFGHRRACFPPQLKYFTFYGENDCTLGQYIDSSVMDTLVQFLDPKAVCEGKGCGQPTARHCKVYVHNETRLFVAVEQWDGQITDQARYYASPETIITWSACRVCGSATPFIPVSEEMQRYSFAKFLELHFYPADVQLVQGAGCQHNIYAHHIRYFATRGMTVRFQADPVALHEVVYPPMHIRVRPETQLEIKNRDFHRLHHRNNLWYSALIDDLKLINIDAATGDEEADAVLTANINNLIARAEWEKNEVAKSINRIYRDSASTDTIALNQIRAQRQDYIVAWQSDFDRLPKPRMSQSMDKTSRRSYAFGSVRAMWPRGRYDLYDPHVPSSSVSEAEESGPPMTLRKVTGDSMISVSSNSEASESESVAGVSLHSRIMGGAEAIAEDSAAEQSAKSDAESDSTIGVSRDEAKQDDMSPLSQDEQIPDSELTITADGKQAKPVSRLPRRSAHYPSVAELVRRYQDFLPPQGVEELTRTAFPPGVPVSESEAEGAVISPTRPRFRHKQSHRFVARKGSVSDFEQSYAANIAPRYLTHAKRPLTQASGLSRIPGPAVTAFDSRPSSRRSSPDKRPSFSRTHTETTFRTGRSSPPPGSKMQNTGPFIPKNKGKATIRLPRDRVPSRPTSSSGPKSTMRRPTNTGTKVSNIAKHFERISKDNDKANRRYAVIRGRRARPVTTARAKVEILDSIKDAIKDESESSDSSEADDEGDDEDDAPDELEKKSSPAPGTEESTDASAVRIEETPSPAMDEQRPSSEQSANKIQDDTLLKPPGEAALGSIFSPSSSVPPSPSIQPMHITPLTSPPPELDIGTAGTERQSSILKALSGFWPQPQASRIVDNDDPMADPEHIFRDSSMVVRTDEPTSIIALALNSPQYRDLLAKSRADKRQAKEAKLTDGGEAFMPDDKSLAESNSTWGVVNVESGEGIDPTEELRVPSSKLPWAISFESGGLTISCTVLYPEQFDALRRTYDCEKSMIESLARCFKWDTGGGKSGSAFLKTLDDRFIAKELSRAEIQAMETFAPSYFDYMSSALGANRPTLLAKIFGVFKITFRKTHKDRNSKSKPTQMNLMVMENLFYDRRFSKIYDLKGSTRNRHVPSTGRENEVLLDENLVETAHLTPFYLREHSKRILRGALFNDSRFLADFNVMDYSLLVGVDSTNNELVVGIVDYVRTYTWDKKLESWVKDSAFLGGGANKGEPTIIGPKQYRQRFLSAMERYFPLVPDRWMKQHDAPEEEGNNLLDLWPDW
ncbi:1-phosphatidylinositol-3-phosphate 5-kinase [Steccherinum ochraceum]|uniref:1-phosphatidylinositol-3-phosphate 5-kinase n=1 Tax=Steccherinum ochraceum TaxID=92696 RepID=A0A4R0RSD3_9APHY|nr:1-phosphatidylinositol-3-phosphate 5-kinase [Steccherinum ochraceum]